MRETTSSGEISSPNSPAFCAASAFWCEASANASWSSRNTFHSSAYVGDNHFVGPLSCTGNEPEIDGGSNTVTGPKTGQCAGL